jgi:hypothetical protein
MINAFVLYGTPEQPNQKIFEIGLELFDALNIKDYSIHQRKLNRLGYGINKVINEEGLIGTFDNEPFSFEISHNDKGRLFYFSQSVRLVGAYNAVKFGGFSSDELPVELADHYIKRILEQVGCQYGFSYQSRNSFKAINYVNDIGVDSFNPYDAPMKWQRKFIYIKDDTEYSRHMRIVYQRNYLTENHLALTIEGCPLGDWIRQDERRGNLSSLNDDVYLWQVAPEHLQDVNLQCGRAGLLISFVEPKRYDIKKTGPGLRG